MCDEEPNGSARNLYATRGSPMLHCDVGQSQVSPGYNLISALRRVEAARRLSTSGVEPLIELVGNPGDTLALKKQGRAVCQVLLLELPKLSERAFKIDTVEFLLGYTPVTMSALPPGDLERLETWHCLLSTLYGWLTENRRFESAVENGPLAKLNEVQASLSTFLADLELLLTPLVDYWQSASLQQGQT